MLQKDLNRKKRHFRIRKKIHGSQQMPRLYIKRSLSNFYVQVIDDINERTLLGFSTLSPEVRTTCSYGGNIKAAEALATVVAAKMKEQGMTKVCFDRAGYAYHGRIKAFAETLRKEGIAF